MTVKVRQNIEVRLDSNQKQLRQIWEGYHLLEFAKTIRPIKQDTKGRNKLDDLFESNGIGGFQTLQKLPSDNSAFTTEKSEGVFKSLSEFQDIPTFVCFINFLEFCRNSEPYRPLDVFDGNDKIFIEVDGKRESVTLDYAIADFKKYAKTVEEELKREHSQGSAEQSGTDQLRLTIPQADEENKNYYASTAIKEVIGRDKQKERLEAFLECDKSVMWFQLAGEAGQGKSRLAFDLMHKALKLDWCAGFIEEDDIEFFKDHWKDWQPDKPHLFIFDYVIGREEKIKHIFNMLLPKLSDQRKYEHNIRILLLERQRWNQGAPIKVQDQNNNNELKISAHIGDKASWFLKLCKEGDFEAKSLRPHRFGDGVEELKRLDKNDLVSIVKQLFDGKELIISDDALKETLERIDSSGRPLYAYFLAQQLSDTQIGYQSWTKIDLLNYQLMRDKEHRWKKAFKDDAPTWGNNHPAMKLAVLATITREVKFQDEQIEQYFGEIDSSVKKEVVAITSGYLVKNDNCPREIHALEPDLLGAWFVLYCFYRGLDFTQLLNLAWQYSPDNTAIFLLRITQDFIDLPKEFKSWDVTEKLLAQTPPHKNHYHNLANVAADITYNLYNKRLSIPKNIIAALECAVNLSNPVAMNCLAFLYYQGTGVTRNLEISVDLQRQAAGLGNSQAMVNLGSYYQNGEGVDQDSSRAVKLYQQAVDLGNSKALVNLGFCYEKGEGVDQDRSKAVQLYQQAVDLGSCQGMVNLGSCYQYGIGVDQNLSEAIRLYRQAVDLGEGRAMVILAICYQTGIGVDHDWNEAVRLFRRAIDLGEGRAMVILGFCYEKGEGVEQDWNEAIRLYQLAVKAGDNLASDCLQSILLLQNFLTKSSYENQKIKTWPNTKRLRFTAAPEFDPPIMAGAWKSLTAKEVTVHLNKAMASFEILDLIQNLDDYCGQYGRFMPLNFYQNCYLIDIQLYSPSNKNTLIFSAVFNLESAILLSGNAKIIHGINTDLLTFSEKQSSLNYLQFFCSYIWNGHSPIQIISNLNEISFNGLEINQQRQEIEKSVFIPRHIEGCFKSEGWQKFEACALNEDTIFMLTFKVRSNGMVSLEGKELILNKLPILHRQYNGVFRSPLRSI